jgi:hypothetical protein
MGCGICPHATPGKYLKQMFKIKIKTFQMEYCMMKRKREHYNIEFYLFYICQFLKPVRRR